MLEGIWREFGPLVRQKREQFGFSQRMLADRTGLSLSAISNLESGRTGLPQAHTRNVICKVLQISRDELASLESSHAILPDMIPAQDPLVRIEANADNKLELQSSYSDDDDRSTIETYRSQFLEILAQEIDRYDKNRNRPQAAHFLPRHQALVSELSKPVEDINFAAVYLAVSRLTIAREKAELEVARHNTEWPAFDPDENEAIDSLCLLGGPLIMASALGRKLVTDNAMYNLKESDEAEADRLLSFYIQAVREQGIVSGDTDAFLDAVDTPAKSDPNPQRTRRVKFALVGSFMVLTAGAAAVSFATLPAAAAVGTSSLAFLPYIWSKKVIENDPDFTKLVKNGGTALQDSSSKLSEGSAELIRKLSGVFRNNYTRLERMGELVSEFKWVKVFVRRINNDVYQKEERATGRSFLLTQGESVFDAAFATPEGNSRSWDISEGNGLHRVIKVSRPGDSLVLLWKDEATMKNVIQRLISSMDQEYMDKLLFCALVTKKLEPNSILFQFAPKIGPSIGSFAPEFMAHHNFDEVTLYELTL